MNVGKTNQHGNGLLFAGFNQNQEFFAIGTDKGFRIYICSPLKEIVRQDFADGGFASVEMNLSSNYLAMVGRGTSPKYPTNKVLVWDDLKKDFIKTLEFNSDVLCVRLSNDRIVVVLEGLIKVYTFTWTPQQIHVFQTHSNPKGLCMFNNYILAFPAYKMGHVELVDLADNDKPYLVIAAHKSKLGCIALNFQGTRLATASIKGTLIRVFDTESGNMLYEFLRGINVAQIYCINFNADSTIICVASDRGTIHIFALEDQSLNKQSCLTLYFLPKYFTCRRSFCKFQVPNYPQCVCAFGLDKNCIMVICADGNYYKFKYNQKGECWRVNSNEFLQLNDGN